jgi:triosephosphate isomerase
MKKIIIANWKMNPQTFKEAENLFLGIAKIAKLTKNTDVVVCVPYIFLPDLKKKNVKKVSLGAQNVFYEDEGSYTGEISLTTLKSLGVKYVILGHSERRAMGENNEFISKKLLATLKKKITPILCIGESSRDYSGDYLSFIKKQITECLTNIPKSQIKNIIIAYEPIWAIGKNAIREATPEEFIEISIFSKKIISDISDQKTAYQVRILYGGSVNSKNAEQFFQTGKADGLLVGGASLKVKDFSEIISIAEKK